MENTQLRPEALLMIIKYCIDMKGGNLTYKYIITVAKDFISRGITTEALVGKELTGYFTTTKEVAEVYRALKSNKKPEIEDIKTYKKYPGIIILEIDGLSQEVLEEALEKGYMPTLKNGLKVGNIILLDGKLIIQVKLVQVKQVFSMEAMKISLHFVGLKKIKITK